MDALFTLKKWVISIFFKIFYNAGKDKSVLIIC